MNPYKQRKKELWVSDSVKIWESNYGFHKIPKEFDDVVFKKNGTPDKRYKKAKHFTLWASALDDMRE